MLGLFGLDMRFGAKWVDPFPLLVDSHGNLPEIEFRYGSVRPPDPLPYDESSGSQLSMTDSLEARLPGGIWMWDGSTWQQHKTQDRQPQASREWAVAITSVFTERILKADLGGTRMLYPASSFQRDYYLILSLELLPQYQDAELAFSVDSTYLLDEKGNRFPMKGRIAHNGGFDPFVVEWSYKWSYSYEDVRLVFPVLAGSNEFRLKLSGNMDFITVPPLTD